MVNSSVETDDNYLRIREAVKVSGLARTSLYSAIQRGSLKATKRLDILVIHRADLDAYQKKARRGRPKVDSPNPNPSHESGADNDHEGRVG